ncbi:hypothetical protein K439DRAFT_155872 [Ramaria rubella]|nr:hypothetical protein K439DRAFT_155872 [Ramaria rubella]
MSNYDVPLSKVVRTPDDRFRDIPGFPYTPRYEYLGSLRYSFIDITSGILCNGRELLPTDLKGISAEDIHWETYLCLHGQPTWSYLYRRMIPVFLHHSPAGSHKYIRRRVLAPDFFGCGRSDKPVDDALYTWDMHMGFLINCELFPPFLGKKTMLG